ncbi:MAG TPA: hypothetical protein VGG05_08285 [Pseudonocardiaceae bacterium]|jgi:hypothetical protein
MPTPGGWPAQRAHQQQVQHDRATFAAHQNHVRYRRRRGPAGPHGRLFGVVFALVFLAVAVWIFLTVLSGTEPDRLDHVRTWIGQLL